MFEFIYKNPNDVITKSSKLKKLFTNPNQNLKNLKNQNLRI